MTSRRLAAFALISFALAGCAGRDEDPKPVIPPLLAETVQRAEAGDAAAQFGLADHYRASEPLEPMLRWMREFARQGYPLAQTSLGVLYGAGDGVPLDRLEAYLWFARAAAQGQPDAVAMVASAWAELSAEARELARQGAQ